jgi:hypothetical protein
VAAGAVGAASDFGAAQPGSAAGAAHDGSVFAAHDGSDELAQLPESQLEQELLLEQELQLELESQLEQDDLQHRCLNKPPKWKPPPQPPQATACDCIPATAKQAAATTIINTRFMEASSKQC